MLETAQALLPDQLDAYAPMIVGALAAFVIFVLGWIASKWAGALFLRSLRKRSVDEALARFLSSIVQYLVLAAAVITALSQVGVESTSLVALLGAAGLAIGLALQGSLSNFAAGVMILLFRPFTIGHKIEAAGRTGKVTEVGLFASTLRTPDNEVIIIPNSEITASSIVNYTVEGKLRAGLGVGVAYGSDLKRVEEVIVNALQGCDLVLADPEPAVAFVGFGASSLDLNAMPWSTSEDFVAMQHQARVAIYDALNAADIEIPFDQIVVHQESE